jgi:imidazolonepropionase
MHHPTLWIRNASQIVLMNEGFDVVNRGAVICSDDRILWIGRDGDWPDELIPGDGDHVLDADGGVVTPGLIDCHTHLVFAGSRAGEFARRLQGATYEEILAEGGGILGTVRATRAASVQELMDLGRQRLGKLLGGGVTTVEVKSGYGLEFDAELRILEAAKGLGQEGPVDVVPTFLGAHAVPAEYRDDREAYLDAVVDRMLPAVAERGLARFCDVFCEPGLAFDRTETRRVLEAARDLGLGLKVHADQLSLGGGSRLAGDLGAVSADHLEFIDEAGIATLARAGAVAVLLPGAAFFLAAPVPPVSRLRKAGVPIALSTDLNPGSSPTSNLLLMTSMASVQWKLTVEESLMGITANAARALDLQDDRGQLAPGLRADLALFDVPDYRDLVYWFGESPCRAVVKDGQVVVQR